MIRSEGLTPDGQRALLQRQCGVEILLLGIQYSQGTQAARDIGMIGPHRVLPDFESPPQSSLGLAVMALARVEIGQIGKDFGDLGMTRPKLLLSQAERAKTKALRIGVARLRPI